MVLTSEVAESERVVEDTCGSSHGECGGRCSGLGCAMIRLACCCHSLPAFRCQLFLHDCTAARQFEHGVLVSIICFNFDIISQSIKGDSHHILFNSNLDDIN